MHFFTVLFILLLLFGGGFCSTCSIAPGDKPMNTGLWATVAIVALSIAIFAISPVLFIAVVIGVLVITMSVLLWQGFLYLERLATPDPSPYGLAKEISWNLIALIFKLIILLLICYALINGFHAPRT